MSGACDPVGVHLSVLTAASGRCSCGEPECGSREPGVLAAFAAPFGRLYAALAERGVSWQGLRVHWRTQVRGDSYKQVAYEDADGHEGVVNHRHNEVTPVLMEMRRVAGSRAGAATVEAPSFDSVAFERYRSEGFVHEGIEFAAELSAELDALGIAATRALDPRVFAERVSLRVRRTRASRAGRRLRPRTVAMLVLLGGLLVGLLALRPCSAPPPLGGAEGPGLFAGGGDGGPPRPAGQPPPALETSGCRPGGCDTTKGGAHVDHAGTESEVERVEREDTSHDRPSPATAPAVPVEPSARGPGT